MASANLLERTRRTFYGEIENVNSGLLEWQEVDGQPGNYIKVLALDFFRQCYVA